MSLFTKWACFECRKSFAKEPVADGEPARICPDCKQPMIEMGKYFEPPRKQAKNTWAVMKILAENNYKFYSEGAQVYIKIFILRSKNPRLSLVKEAIKADKQARRRSEQEQRLKFLKES